MTCDLALSVFIFRPQTITCEQMMLIPDMAIFQLARARLRPLVLTRVKSSVSTTARLSSSLSTDAPDYYGVLGVSKSATQPEIKQAFVKLASQYDEFMDSESEKFMLIMEAYETLREEESRKEYDLMGQVNRELAGDSVNSPFLVRKGDEATKAEMEGENVEEGESMSDKRGKEIREQLRGLVLAAWSLFCLISVPKCAIWLMGDPGLRLTDWAVRDK